MTVIVDYGRGNVFSLCQALRHLGISYRISNDPDEILNARRLILPGVGAFGAAMDDLRARGLVEPLREAAQRGTPLAGICLGMQLVADSSDEFGEHEGLGLVPAAVRRLPDASDEDGIRIPNVGWRPLHMAAGHAFLAGVPEDLMVYFVHSFGMAVEDPADLAATITVNGIEIAAIVHRRNVVGYQFHPEKSGPAGLDLLRRFLDIPPVS